MGFDLNILVFAFLSTNNVTYMQFVCNLKYYFIHSIFDRLRMLNKTIRALLLTQIKSF